MVTLAFPLKAVADEKEVSFLVRAAAVDVEDLEVLDLGVLAGITKVAANTGQAADVVFVVKGHRG